MLKSDFSKQIAVLWMILASGTVYFTLLNMKVSMIVLLALAILCALKANCMVVFTKRNRVVCIFFLILIVINSLINLSNGFLVEDFIIVMIKLLSVALVASSLTASQFQNYYIKFISIIALISVVCWLLTSFGISIPLSRRVYVTEQYFEGAFYYLYEPGKVFYRNKGLFWEPGLYQIFLNLGIVFALNRISMGEENIRKYVGIIFLLVATVLTTQSSTGYICLAIVLIYALLFVYVPDKSLGFMRRNGFRFIIIAGIIGLFLVENNIGIMEQKVLNQGGSYITRMDDTIGCLKASLENPVFGTGWFANNFREVTMKYGVAYNNSSCLGAIFVRFGYPLALAFLITLFIGIKRLLGMNFIRALVIYLFILLSFATESVYITPVFLIMFMQFQTETQNSMEIEEV